MPTQVKTVLKSNSDSMDENRGKQNLIGPETLNLIG